MLGDLFVCLLDLSILGLVKNLTINKTLKLVFDIGFGRRPSDKLIFSRSTPSLAGASASELHPILIGWDKSCDIRNIDDIIVRCQQGHILQ